MKNDNALQGDLKNIYDNVMSTPTGNKTPQPTTPQAEVKKSPLPDSPPPVAKDSGPLAEQVSTPPGGAPTSFAFSGKAQNPVKTAPTPKPVEKSTTTPSQTNVTKEATTITKNSSRGPLIIFIVFALLIIWGILWAVILGII